MLLFFIIVVIVSIFLLFIGVLSIKEGNGWLGFAFLAAWLFFVVMFLLGLHSEQRTDVRNEMTTLKSYCDDIDSLSTKETDISTFFNNEHCSVFINGKEIPSIESSDEAWRFLEKEMDILLSERTDKILRTIDENVRTIESSESASGSIAPKKGK